MFIRSFKRHAWSYLTKKMNLNWELRSGIPIIVRNYSDWCTFNDIFANNEYGTALVELLQSEKSELKVLDLGANVGYFTLRLADFFLQEKSGRRLALTLVEAAPEVCDELQRRTAFTNERIKIKIVNGLVGKRSGGATLHYAREDNSNFVSDSVSTDPRMESWGSEVQQYVDIQTLVEDSETIDLIKCDIEGSEFAFIESYPDLLARTQRLVVEFHFPFGDLSGALASIRAAGFDRQQELRASEENPVIYFGRTEPLKAMS